MNWFKTKNNIYILILLALVLIVYGMAFAHDFTNWDDDRNILNNPYIRDFNWQNIKYIFTHPFVGMFIPLTMLTYMFSCIIGGFNSVGYISFNILFHALNVILVYKLMQLFFNKAYFPFLIAAIFAIHPMNIEGVSWLSARSNVIFSFFYLLALIKYVEYTRSQQKKYYWQVLGYFVLACFSKSAAVSLPILLIAIDFYEKRAIKIKSQLNKVPFILISLVFGLLTVYFRVESKHLLNLDHLYNPIDKVFFIFYSFDFYIVKMLVPINLSTFYIYPIKEMGSLPVSYYLSPLLIVALIFFWYKAKKHRHVILFTLMAYFATIFLVLKFVPVGNQIVADRYAYLPCIFLFFGIFKMIENQSIENKLYVQYSIFGVIGIFAILSIVQNRVWQDSFTLYESMIADNPTVSLPFYNRALAWADVKEFEKAELDLNQAIKFDSHTSFWAYMNRGNSRKHLGNYKGALADYEYALKVSPDNALILYNLGTLKVEMNDYKGSINVLERYTCKEPSNAMGYNALGRAYALNMEFDKAIASFSRAIQINSHFTEAIYNRGLAYFNTKDFAKSVNDFNNILKTYPDDVYALYNRGLSLSALGDETSACIDIRSSAQLGYKDAQILYEQHCK